MALEELLRRIVNPYFPKWNWHSSKKRVLRNYVSRIKSRQMPPDIAMWVKISHSLLKESGRRQILYCYHASGECRSSGEIH